MFEPKPITMEAVPAALEKALRYRLLNEPVEAESICRDVLVVDPDNQEALVTLLLALTDQFDNQFAQALVAAKQVLPRLEGDYERAYYEGIIYERWAKAQLDRGLPSEAANNWLREAMRCYELAEQLSGPEEPDAILRWNACVRELERHAPVSPGTDSLTYDVEAGFGDDTQTL
jgi:tetratricopeptide (TPR) repeat protein